MLSHLQVHEVTDNNAPPPDDMRSSKNELFNPIIRSRNEYDAPMNLVLTEQASVPPKMYTPWPDLHDAYAPYQ